MSTLAEDPSPDLAGHALPEDTVGLLEGLTTTRAIRRYREEAVPAHVLRAVLFPASRAPSAVNLQPFRFIVLTDGPKAKEAKALIGATAREQWGAKVVADGYRTGSGTRADSPKARIRRTMQEFVEHFDRVPALIFACVLRNPEAPPLFDGASIYPACQNLLLASRAVGYGGVMTAWHIPVEAQLRSLLDIPDDVLVAAMITLGRPVGSHGPVRRLPLAQFVFEEGWGEPAPWAQDPPGTRHTTDGPTGRGGARL